MSILWFYHKIIKNPYIRIIIGSSEGDCVLVILVQLYGSMAGLFEGNLFWVGQYDPPPNLHNGSITDSTLI